MITAHQILRAVALHFGVRTNFMTDSKKATKYKVPRLVSMHLIKKHLHSSDSEIQDLIGGTTIGEKETLQRDSAKSAGIVYAREIKRIESLLNLAKSTTKSFRISLVFEEGMQIELCFSRSEARTYSKI